MVDTNVSRVTLKDDNSMELTVRLMGLEPGEPVEISGYLTQNSGAFAAFSAAQDLPPADSDGVSVLTVVAVPTTNFMLGEAITVVTQTRARGEAWASVLQGPNDPDSIRLVWTADDWE